MGIKTNNIIAFWRDFFDIEENIIVEFQKIVEKENAVGIWEENPDVDFIDVIIDPSVKEEWEKTFVHEAVGNNPDLLIFVPANLPEKYLLELEKEREEYLDKVAEILISFRKNDKKRSLEK